jgi:long-chain acyl-CoA synthetase
MALLDRPLLDTKISMAWLGTILATIAGSSVFILMNILKKIFPQQIMPSGINVEEQGVPVSGKPNVYKSGLLKHSSEETVDRFYPEVKTLYDGFLRGIQQSKNGNCLGSRKDNKSPYTFQKYPEVWQNAAGLGSSFITKLGLKPENATNVGIYAKNCAEWAISAIACIRYSMVTVPLYDTLGADAVSYIVQQTEIEAIVVEDEAKIKKILDASSSMPSLRHLIAIKPEAVTPELLEKAVLVGIQLHRFDELVEEGKNDAQQDVVPTPDDTYMICYTSGTTGNPKGVILTHRNLVANISAFIRIIDTFAPELNAPEECVSISYLPLSHVFEQDVHWSVLTAGGSIGYFRGDVRELGNDMMALRPTIFPSVPRLWNRFYDGVQAKVQKSGFLSKAMFKKAYERKLLEIKQRIVRNNSVWDKLVFNKIQEQFGGRVRFAITGSAPISPQVLEFCRVTLGAHVMEGYGQTESTAMATATWPGDYAGGHCGGPAVCSLIKLADVPDMGYFAVIFW